MMVKYLISSLISIGVRSAAISTMPYLLTSAVKYLQSQGAAQGADTTYVRNLFNFIYPTLLESLKEESDMELLVLGMESFTEVCGIYCNRIQFAVYRRCGQ